MAPHYLLMVFMYAEMLRQTDSNVKKMGNKTVSKIIINNTVNLFFKPQSAFWKLQTITVSECCLIKLLPYILLENIFIF